MLRYIKQDTKLNKLTPSGVNTEFNFNQNLPFSSYVTYTIKNILALGRLDTQAQPEAIELNAPFIKTPPPKCKAKIKKGIVLIHALTASPYSMRASAEKLQQQCFYVYSILLAGHGTRPSDLLHVTHQTWQQQVHYAVTQLEQQVDEVYLGGYSLGGLLSLLYANEHPNIKGILLFAPALVLHFMAKYAYLIKYIKKWLEIYPEDDVFKYNSFTTNAAIQTYDLTKILNHSIQKKNNLLNLKIVASFSSVDTTIDAAKSIDYLLKITHPNRRKIVIYYQDENNIQTWRDHKNTYFIHSAITEKNILSLSHGALSIAITDEWYGIKGQYRSCVHYKQKSTKHKKCLDSKDIYWGETSATNLNYTTIARTSFNPFLDSFFTDYVSFITE